MLIEEVIKAENLVEFALIFFIAFVGSFAKVYLKMIHSPDSRHKLNFIEIELSTFTATIVVFTFSNNIQAEIGIRGLVLCSFIMGLVGFELLNRVSSLASLMELLSNILSLYGNYKRISDEREKEKKRHNKDYYD